MTQINFNNYKNKLTDDEIEEITTLITSKCRENTKKRIRAHIKHLKNLIPEYGILNRIIKEDNSWSYCAGQSYPDEIRTVREIILKLN